MKKLMIALAAAATTMLSFGAGPSFEVSGTSFEGYPTNILQTAKDDVAGNSGDNYWYTADQDAENIISNYFGFGETDPKEIPIASRPDYFAPSNTTAFLRLETNGRLFRSALPNGQTTEFSPVAIPDQGIYLDTLVKFTAAEDVFGADALEAGIDKIAIEYVEREDDDTTPENEALTNFVVRAGYVTGEGTVTATNYFASVPADFDKDAWHRLTVRAIADVGDGTVGFIVYLDGNMNKMLTYSTDVAAGYDGYIGNLNNFVKENFYCETVHALFPSAVRTGGDKSNISAVAFQGNGSVDDVTFTANKPGFIQEVTTVTVTWDTNKVTAVTLNDIGLSAAEWAVGSYEIAPLNGGVVTFGANFAEGYTRGECTVTGGGNWDGFSAFENLSAGAVCNIVAMKPLYQVGETYFDDLDAAIEAAAAGTAQAPATFKLLADCGEMIKFTSGYVVLDLAGYNIQGTDEQSFSVVCQGAHMIVTNSVPATGAVKRPVENEDATGAMQVKGDDGAVAVYVAKFDDIISVKPDNVEKTAIFAIYSGTFIDEDAGNDPDAFAYNVYVQNGATVTSLGNNYFQVGTAAPQPSGYDSGDGEHTFTIAADREAALESNLPTGKTLADKVSETSDLTYAQAYALGLWSENSATVEELDATITVGADGKVTVSLATAPTTGYLVQCKVYEKASLTAEWPTEAKATYAYGNEQAFTPGSATAGFYKVAVVITNALQQ